MHKVFGNKIIISRVTPSPYETVELVLPIETISLLFCWRKITEPIPNSLTNQKYYENQEDVESPIR
jgi:hypothetical protein